MDPKDLSRIIQEFTGKELSEKDLYDYAYFLKGSESIFDEKRREQIRAELASIVMHNKGLAKKISEEYGLSIIGYAQDSSQLNLSFFNTSDYQKNTIAAINKENKVMANMQDIYRYFKSIVYLHENGDYKQVERADSIIKNIRSNCNILTSTRVFFRGRSLDAQIVHYYNVTNRKPKVASINLPCVQKNFTEAMNDSAVQDFVKVLLGTDDDGKTIADVFGFIFNKPLEKICIFSPSQNDRLVSLQATAGVWGDNDIKLGVHFGDFKGYSFYIDEPKK